MIEKVNLLAAAGSIVMGNAGAVNFVNGGAFVRTGAGVYTFTSDTPLALSAAVPQGQLIVAAGVAGYLTVQQTSATVWTLTTSATLGGGAADVVGSLSFMLWAIGAPGTSGV